MRKIICILLVFALLVSSVSAATSDMQWTDYGSYYSLKLYSIDTYTRNMSGSWGSVPRDIFDSYVLQCLNLNQQVAACTGSSPFSTQSVAVNGTATRYITIAFNASALYTFPSSQNSWIVGGRSFTAGSHTIGALFNNVFPAGLNYTAQTEAGGVTSTYYLPKIDSKLLLYRPEFDNDADFSELFDKVDSIASDIYQIRYYSDNLANPLLQACSSVFDIADNTYDALGYLDQISSQVATINNRLNTIISLDNTMITDIENFFQMQYQADQIFVSDFDTIISYLSDISSKLSTIERDLVTLHRDFGVNNDLLQDIKDDLEAAKTKEIDTGGGVSLFSMISNFFSIAFTPIIEILKTLMSFFMQFLPGVF